MTTAALRSILLLASERPDALPSLSEVLRRGAEVMEYLSELPQERRPRTTKLIAAALYQLSGFEANATCVARGLTSPQAPDAGLDDLFDRWTALALQRQFIRLRVETEASLSDAERLRRLVVESLQATDGVEDDLNAPTIALLGAAAFRELSLAVLQGPAAEARFWRATEDLSTFLLEAGLSLELLELRTIEGFARTLFTNGMWEQLGGLIAGDAVWRRYATLSARGAAPNMLNARSHIELWESQRLAVRSGLLSEGGRGHAVRMPTSAGKTRIAELAALRVLSGPTRRRVLYVAPYRALADEVERSLAPVLADLGFAVSTVLGGFEVDELEAQVIGASDLLVCTPEKLALLTRATPDLFADVGLLILDEGHVIESKDRGIRYELLITRLKRLMASDAKTLFVSAVVPEDNARDFAEWLCSDRDAVIETEWRPARRRIGIFNAESGRIAYPLEGPVAGAPAPFVLGAAQPRQYIDFTPKQRREKTVDFPTKAKGDLSAELAINFADQGPVLIFTTTRPFAESVARAVMRGLRLRQQTPGADLPEVVRDVSRRRPSASLATAERWLGPESGIVELLTAGIGVHHAGLPDAVRRAVEDDFRAGALPILVATTTLAQGVNLPVKTVIVHTLTWRSDDEDDEADGPVQRTTNPRDFWNIAGRAGRAGQETEGHIVLVATSDWEARVLTDYLRQEVPPLQGQLFAVLERLVEQRISDEEIRLALDPELIALLVEESVGTESESLFRELIDDSLVNIQARRAGISLDPLQVKGAQVVAHIRDEVPDEGLRAAYARTGFDVTSCRKLHDRILARGETIREILTAEDASLYDILLAVLPDLVDLPQMATGYEFVGDLPQLTVDWVEQVPMPEITARHLGEGVRRTDEQKFHRYLADVFGLRLPWGFNAYVTIAGHVLDLGGGLSETTRWLSTMIRFGVSTAPASWAMTMGCPSRELAASLALAYADSTQVASYPGFVEWFATLTEEDFILRFDAAPYEAEVLTRRASALVPPDRQLTEMLRAEAGDFQVQVAGLQFERRFAILASAAVGQSVDLVRDYSNQYDPNAIEVHLNGQMLGYVPRNTARLVAPQLDSGLRAASEIVELDRDQHSPSVTVRVRLASAPARA